MQGLPNHSDNSSRWSHDIMHFHTYGINDKEWHAQSDNTHLGTIKPDPIYHSGPLPVVSGMQTRYLFHVPQDKRLKCLLNSGENKSINGEWAYISLT